MFPQVSREFGELSHNWVFTGIIYVDTDVVVSINRGNTLILIMVTPHLRFGVHTGRHKQFCSGDRQG